jgi:hypothetical protein
MPHKTEIYINYESPSSLYEKRKIAYYRCTDFNLSHVLYFLLSPIRLSCQIVSSSDVTSAIKFFTPLDATFHTSAHLTLVWQLVRHKSHPAVYACTCITTWNWPIEYLLSYLLAYSMEQSPSWEANWFSASQDIPCILWKPKVHYRIHRYPPLVPNSDQILYYPLSIKCNCISNLTLKAISDYCI